MMSHSSIHKQRVVPSTLVSTDMESYEDVMDLISQAKSASIDKRMEDMIRRFITRTLFSQDEKELFRPLPGLKANFSSLFQTFQDESCLFESCKML